MKISIVSTLYRSAPFLPDFCSRMINAAEKLTPNLELVLVDDGSPDNSLEVALEIQKKEPRIQILELSRNFGHHSAIIAGLEATTGDLIYLTDCDLEEQPEWISLFFEIMQENQIDVIYGIQKQRVSDPVSNFLGSSFWKILNAMSDIKIPENPMTCRLMKRSYVDSLLRVEDHVLYLAGTFAWSGFKQEGIELTKQNRPGKSKKKSTYNFSRKLLQVVDSFSSFSAAPLYFIFLIGILIWLGSLIFGIYLLVWKLLNPELVLSGFTSIMLSIWFFSGIIIVTLSIVGLYIAKIFQEVKRRPLYLIRNIHRGKQDV